MKLLNLDFTRVAHDCFRIAGSKVLYTDPFKVTKQDKADLVVISHEHFDHLAEEDLNKVMTPETVIVASHLCAAGLEGTKVKKSQSGNEICSALLRVFETSWQRFSCFLDRSVIVSSFSLDAIRHADC